MKHLTIFFTIILFANVSQAQNNNFESLWKQVEAFDAEGLPKSALKIVEQISEKAKKTNNKPQIIKALLHKSKYALILEEDAQLTIINDFKVEISQSETPTKNVLESILADLYWQYFQQNRWKFYNRTKTDDKVNETDFRTWDLETLFSEIKKHHNNALQNGLILQQTSLETYDELLILQKNSKTFRPTLFDLLAHNALDFYKTNENSITKPAYKFEIDNPNYLSDVKTFSRLELISKDTTSLQLQALKIFQDLIQFHLKDKSPEALVDVDIERLNFVAEHATFSNKETKLEATLKSSKDFYNSKAVSGLYSFELAKLWHQQGSKYAPKTNESAQWKVKDAYNICQSVITAFPKSIAADKCDALKKSILKQNIQIQTESFLPIQEASRLLVSYRNINNLKFDVYKLNEKQFALFNKTYREDEQLAFIKKLTASKTWETTLKNEGDYQNHSTEVIMPALENGRYLIVASVLGNDTFATQTIQVTNIAAIDKTENNKQAYQFVNRNTGKPIQDIDVKITYKKNYNGRLQSKNLTSNSKGLIEIIKDGFNWTQVKIEATTKKDKAYFGDYYINQSHITQKENTTYNGFIFTDRSIYRPGQTVYFKGIAMKTDHDKSEVLANENLSVTLYDTNYEIVKELKFKTNEFGSISGEFILPNNGLTGYHTLDLKAENKTIHASSSISVEEYKRPKFETNFAPITETFKINDSIKVKGTALAYAGSNITDAKVVYRVHRKVQYPSWYYWSRPAFFSESQEISHGETTTDDKGAFEITFKAIPDLSVDKSSQPIFNYEITADVTDLNGETRSATTIVNVGYHAMTATVSVANLLDKTNKDHTLEINTQNLNGEFVPASGTIKIYKLQAPKYVLRDRPWEAPDYLMLSETAFKNQFPHDAYQDEDNPNNWKKGLLVFEKHFDTKTSKTVALDNIKKWQSGQYIIVLESKDSFKQDVKAEAKTTLYSDKDNTLADNQLFSITTNKTSYDVNDTAEITIGSSAKNITVTLDVEKNHETINTYIIDLNNNKKTIKIPVTKDDIGGFAVHYSFAFANSHQSGSEIISVPYPKTDLEIETTTFRDKLQPGKDETWSFKIKGPKGEQVSAELLASMYDASLDQFKPHNWSFNPIHKTTYSSYNRRNAAYSFGTRRFRIQNLNQTFIQYPHQSYDQLNWFGLSFGHSSYYFKSDKVQLAPIAEDKKLEKENVVESLQGKVSGLQINTNNNNTNQTTRIVLRGNRSLSGNTEALIVIDGKIASSDELQKLSAELIENTTVLKGANGAALYGSQGANGVLIITTKKANFSQVKVRINLQETAFFFPQLQTDENGNVSFNFTTPEALTKWKLQLLAHTKTLHSAVSSFETVTQKELMVLPNTPRFLRQGDVITISTKIANLTEEALSGQAKLELTDAISGKDINQDLISSNVVETFSVDAKGNTQVSWTLNIPDNVSAIQYKIIAKSGDFSDGEQSALPVLTNRMLVTETLPMWIKSNETRTFTLDKLKNNASTTLKHHKLTLEMTSNPAWYAVQALPYLMEYPYDCNEQTFSRYYANALASHIANSNPRIQEVFNQWASQDALISNLEKNEELKSILIQETPWLRDAQSETEQKKRIALLFDMNKMNNELQSALRKLQQNQMSNGAWSWFKGGRENRYITQHIITGFGHLKHLNVNSSFEEQSMIEYAIEYLDAEFVKEYKDLKKYNSKVDLSKDHLSYTQLHYLYMRSFFPEIKASKEVEDITKYYHTQIQKYWLSRSLYAKGLMALITHRMEDNKTASKILKSLKENSITSEELGMYWKENTSSWYWYQAPIETQALLIEAFSEIENDTKTVDNLKIWLLKNKQTNQWKTTKATTEAVYALLLQGSDWLSVTEMVDVVLGNEPVEPSKLETVKVEAGTGYYKTSWNSTEIKPEMAEVKLTKKGNGIAWGSLYWQYFEDLDKITSAETPLKLQKKLFKKNNTDTGEELTEITSETHLEVGDLVRVRIELRSDRAMEFVHMKDMQAAGLEPVNVLSQYKWQDGLGYYEATKDASTNFFFDYLPKGIYVFEYDLRVNNSGDMSNGITTIQSMYAPEFSSHSEGVRISVNN
ncbi:alpha-2-macroglobulin family protein [Corallibacter sp.]|uniref:alpha-2-macroglobulin family protein n=1 Tax=Corallibacter sp. TaxID=2038084 RepID=UPI003A948E56